MKIRLALMFFPVCRRASKIFFGVLLNAAMFNVLGKICHRMSTSWRAGCPLLQVVDLQKMARIDIFGKKPDTRVACFLQDAKHRGIK